MAKTRLLSSVCAAVMLAAVPALAQNSTQPGDTTGGASTTPPAASPASPPAAATGTDTTPADKMESGSTSHPMGSRAMRHSSMHARRGGSATAQDGAVDRLNEQSYQAARNGQSFSGGSSEMPASGGGSMSGAGSAGSANVPGSPGGSAGSGGAAGGGGAGK